MKSFIGAFWLLFLACAPAHAEEPWSGPYIGLTLGNAWGSADPQSPSNITTLHTESLVVGPRVGYDHQFGGVVIGALGDFLVATDLDGSVPDGNFIKFGGDTDWIATVRGRIGVPIFEDRLLPYFTGGIALADSTASMTCPPGAKFGFCSVAGAFRDKQNDLIMGYVVGAGLEWRLDENWSFLTEYLYEDFGNERVQFNSPLGPLPAGESHVEIHTVGVSIIFRFPVH